MSTEMKDYVDEMEEKLNNGSTTTFKKYRFYKMAEAMIDLQKKENIVCPDGHELVLMIDDTTAIVEQYKPSFIDYPFSIVMKGKCINNYYKNIEHALLGWMGRKHNGSNEGFSEFAYRALMAEEV